MGDVGRRRWFLRNVEAKVRYPVGIDLIPKADDRYSLQPGQCARVEFQDFPDGYPEMVSIHARVWIRIEESGGDGFYVGTVGANQRGIGTLGPGDPIPFHANNVVDVDRTGTMGTEDPVDFAPPFWMGQSGD